MKNIIFLISIIVFISGCRNTMVGLTGRDYDEYIASIKPELYYWHKNGAREEQKTKDWVKCGGHPNGQFIWNKIQIKKEMRPNDINNDYYRYLAYERLRNKTRNCMKNKGYVH